MRFLTWLFGRQRAIELVPRVITGSGSNPVFYLHLFGRHSGKLMWMHPGSFATFEQAHAYIETIGIHDGYLRIFPDER